VTGFSSTKLLFPEGGNNMTVNNMASNIINNNNTGVNLFGTNSTNSTNSVTSNANQPSSNASSPLNMNNFVAAIRGHGNQMSEAANTLLARNQSVFSDLTAQSSNNSAVTVSIANQSEAAAAARHETMNVSVQQVASAQQNLGTAMNARQINDLGTSTHQFTIQTGGTTHEFSIDVRLTDSNRMIQQRMADAINSRNIGVTADVQLNGSGSNETATLSLTSRDSGERNGFTIADAEDGSLVSTMGIDSVAREAQNARFTVNGEQRTHNSNQVELGNGINATLRTTTTENVTVRTQNDSGAITGVINNLVNSFNGMHENASRYAGRDTGARTLLSRLNSISGMSGLRNIGIDRQRDGSLQIDTDRLARAIEDGSAEQFLNDRQGFTQRLAQLGRTVENNPEQFVGPRNRLTLGETGSNNNNSGNTNNDTNNNNSVTSQPGRNPVNNRFTNRQPGFNSEEAFANQNERDMFRVMMSRQNMRMNMVGMLFSWSI